MSGHKIISGFSRLSRPEKIAFLKELVPDGAGLKIDLDSHLHADASYRQLYNEFSENTVSNFYLPFGVAPNFIINDRQYTVPMVIEESSVVAAASAGAGYWSERGGFRSTVKSTVKTGQVHFLWSRNAEELRYFFNRFKPELIRSTNELTQNMQKRGGGIAGLELIDKTGVLENYYQLFVKFETADSMGANFINSVLEKMAAVFHSAFIDFTGSEKEGSRLEIIMAILSNHAPECIVETFVECRIDELSSGSAGISPLNFAKKFKMAVDIASADTYRAVTHNKGIYNGIDAVLMATGNDYRAAEAQGHAWASVTGNYRGLSQVSITGDTFRFGLEIPLTVGTVGGLTRLHPLARRALEILGKPSAKQLMQIASAAGLANNFSAVKSLITVGIQKGHMQLHLSNILHGLNASENEIAAAAEYFRNKTVSVSQVQQFVKNIRDKT